MSTMKISLTDINDAGKEFDYKTGQDAELDRELETGIEGLKEFQVNMLLARAGDIYTANGRFSLHKDDQCSLCGEDIDTSVKTNFTEYVVIEDRTQPGHAPHSGLNYETNKETYFIESEEFDVFDFLREVMTTSLPAYPRCVDTVQCEANRRLAEEKMSQASMKGHPAFSVLSKLKDNKS